MSLTMTSMRSRARHRALRLSKRASQQGPVLITEQGKTTHVLLSIETYQKFTHKTNIVDMLACPLSDDFEPIPLSHNLLHSADFS